MSLGPAHKERNGLGSVAPIRRKWLRISSGLSSNAKYQTAPGRVRQPNHGVPVATASAKARPACSYQPSARPRGGTPACRIRPPQANQWTGQARQEVCQAGQRELERLGHELLRIEQRSLVHQRFELVHGVRGEPVRHVALGR